jgi:hypothetical protein
VLVQRDGIFLDLSTGDRTGVGIGLLGVNEPKKDEVCLDTPAKQVFWGENNLTFRMHSGNAVTSFGNFQALKRVMCPPKGNDMRHCPWSNHTRHNDRSRQTASVALQVKVESNKASSLADVQIDIKDLIRLTSSHAGDKVSVRVFLSTNGDKISQLVEHNTTLHAIRVQMLAALAQIVDKYPDFVRAGNFELYIDSYGDVKSVDIRTVDEQHIFRESAISKIRNLGLLVARYGVVDVIPSYNSVLHYSPDEYDGTLLCWVRYLEEAVATDNEENGTWQRGSRYWQGQWRYFGTSLLGNSYEWAENELQRLPGSFKRPEINVP